ncbi:MAG: hypothetical protein MUF42_16840 [Cytophagaceae bacterium]|jgi:hypothetical protein|nr:hypothetical protein [Cytophagaceae bacterium]
MKKLLAVLLLSLALFSCKKDKDVYKVEYSFESAGTRTIDIFEYSNLWNERKTISDSIAYIYFEQSKETYSMLKVVGTVKDLGSSVKISHKVYKNSELVYSKAEDFIPSTTPSTININFSSKYEDE